MRRPYDTKRCRSLRKQHTEAEHRLWIYLRGHRLAGLKFRRQHPIGPYFVDFYCAEARLVVEIDGSQHLDDVRYDERRTCTIEAAGLRVLRFWNDDVLARTDDVLDAIVAALDSPLPALRAVPLPASGERDR
jgi:adenine-specific DNA-methyltransferase